MFLKYFEMSLCKQNSFEMDTKLMVCVLSIFIGVNSHYIQNVKNDDPSVIKGLLIPTEGIRAITDSSKPNNQNIKEDENDSLVKLSKAPNEFNSDSNSGKLLTEINVEKENKINAKLYPDPLLNVPFENNQQADYQYLIDLRFGNPSIPTVPNQSKEPTSNSQPQIQNLYPSSQMYNEQVGSYQPQILEITQQSNFQTDVPSPDYSNYNAQQLSQLSEAIINQIQQQQVDVKTNSYSQNQQSSYQQYSGNVPSLPVVLILQPANQGYTYYNSPPTPSTFKPNNNYIQQANGQEIIISKPSTNALNQGTYAIVPVGNLNSPTNNGLGHNNAYVVPITQVTNQDIVTDNGKIY